MRSLACVLSLASLAGLAACDGSVSGTGGGGSGGGGAGGAPIGGSGGGGAGGAVGGAGGAGGAVGGAGGQDPFAVLKNLTRVEQGDVPLNVQHKFTVPDRTLGFTLLAEAPSASEVIAFQMLRPPTGMAVISGFTIPGHQPPFGSTGTVACANPQSDLPDAYPVQEGDWRIVLNDDDGSIDSGVVTGWFRRTEDGLFHGGVLDVNVFLIPGVVDQGYMNQVFGSLFPWAGIDEGTITFLPLDASHTLLQTRQEYEDMLASTAGLSGTPTLNLFVVGDFGNQEFGGAIGVAGGIPGAPMQHGTTHSGLAYQPSGNPFYDATVLAHEIGHVAGLFHTTEFAITDTDPLADTPECPANVISGDYSQCPDVSNTMFPIAYGGELFTTSQKRVIQGSAIYRGAVTGGADPDPPLTPLPPAAEAARLDPGALPPGLRASPPAVRGASGPLEALLLGVWCAGGAAPDHLALAWRLAGEAPEDAAAALWAIALDETAPELARGRALDVLRSYGDASEELEALLALAADAGRGSRLRLAAVRAVAAAGDPEAAALARAATLEDPFVSLVLSAEEAE